MSSLARRASWLVLLLALLARPVAAQQTESRILGRILDQSGATMPGATVTVTSKDTGAVRTEVAGSDGTFTITNLSPGAYQIKAELDGFQPVTRDIVLGVGQVSNQPLTLGVAALTESVTVTAAAPVLDTSSARIGARNAGS